MKDLHVIWDIVLFRASPPMKENGKVHGSFNNKRSILLEIYYLSIETLLIYVMEYGVVYKINILMYTQHTTCTLFTKLHAINVGQGISMKNSSIWVSFPVSREHVNKILLSKTNIVSPVDGWETCGVGKYVCCYRNQTNTSLFICCLFNNSKIKKFQSYKPNDYNNFKKKQEYWLTLLKEKMISIKFRLRERSKQLYILPQG